jgi:hypothetical protein
VKTSIYLPDAVAEQAKALGISISGVAREAILEAIQQKVERCSQCGGLVLKAADGSVKAVDIQVLQT